MIVLDLLLTVLIAVAMFVGVLAAIHGISKPPKPLHEMRWYELGDFIILAPLLRRRADREKEGPKD